MKYTIFSVALTALVGLSQAAPLSAGVSEPRNYFEVQVTFQGAPPNVAFFTQSFPADGSFVQISASIFLLLLLPFLLISHTPIMNLCPPRMIPSSGSLSANHLPPQPTHSPFLTSFRQVERHAASKG